MRADHGHQGDDARAAREHQQRTGVVVVPGEPAADRTAQLELVAGFGDPVQVRGNLTVRDALDGDLQAAGLRRTADRVVALRRVAVVRGQLDGNVLAWLMTRPARDLDGERAGGRGLVLRLLDGRDAPAQSPRRAGHEWSFARQSAGTRPAGPGTGCSLGWLSGGASSGPVS